VDKIGGLLFDLGRHFTLRTVRLGGPTVLLVSSGSDVVPTSGCHFVPRQSQRVRFWCWSWMMPPCGSMRAGVLVRCSRTRVSRPATSAATPRPWIGTSCCAAPRPVRGWCWTCDRARSTPPGTSPARSAPPSTSSPTGSPNCATGVEVVAYCWGAVLRVRPRCGPPAHRAGPGRAPAGGQHARMAPRWATRRRLTVCRLGLRSEATAVPSSDTGDGVCSSGARRCDGARDRTAAPRERRVARSAAVRGRRGHRRCVLSGDGRPAGEGSGGPGGRCSCWPGRLRCRWSGGAGTRSRSLTVQRRHSAQSITRASSVVRSRASEGRAAAVPAHPPDGGTRRCPEGYRGAPASCLDATPGVAGWPRPPGRCRVQSSAGARS
jgi:hypothetical protein